MVYINAEKYSWWYQQADLVTQNTSKQEMAEQHIISNGLTHD